MASSAHTFLPRDPRVCMQMCVCARECVRAHAHACVLTSVFHMRSHVRVRVHAQTRASFAELIRSALVAEIPMDSWIHGYHASYNEVKLLLSIRCRALMATDPNVSARWRITCLISSTREGL
eukprot:jgi/Botrbrau1/7328/Bobra.247_3s0023.1